MHADIAALRCYERIGTLYKQLRWYFFKASWQGIALDQLSINHLPDDDFAASVYACTCYAIQWGPDLDFLVLDLSVVVSKFNHNVQNHWDHNEVCSHKGIRLKEWIEFSSDHLGI